jgi:hypothetical protein
MNRQQARSFNRSAAKKIGGLKTIQNEFKQGITVKQAKMNLKRAIQLQSDLEAMGIIKRPTLWQKIKGRTKATFKTILRGL